MTTTTAVFKQHVVRRSLFEKGASDQGVDVSRKVVSYKAVGAGKPLTDQQLSRINTYAPKALTKEQVYYRPVLLAHNGIDRDNERFHDDLLELFAKSIRGKGFFVEGHPGWRDQSPGKGRIFDAHTEVMTPDQFLELTGETLVLPEGVLTGKVLIVDFYMLKLASNDDTQANIDGGIYCFASIGFSAPLYGITDDRGNEIYGEYRPKGEALEGSLVWLGAQPGAGAIKSASGAPPKSTTTTVEPQPEHEQSKGDEHTMSLEKQLAILAAKTGKTLVADSFGDTVVVVIGEKDAKITELTGQVAALQTDAADGKAYRKRLIEDFIKAGVLTGEVKSDEASQKSETDFLMTVPIARLEVMAGKAIAAAKKVAPDKFELPAGDQTDREKGNKEAETAATGTAAGKGASKLSDLAKERADATKK